MSEDSSTSTRGAHTGALLSALRRGTRALGAARTAEGLLLGSGVYLALTALAVGDGQAPAAVPVLFSAGLAGLCAGIAWGFCHRRTLSQVAQDLSRRIGMAEVSAACQDQALSEPQPMAELAARRVLMRVPPRRLWRLALPVSWPLLLAPLAGGVLLSVVSETHPPASITSIQQGTMESVRAGATAAADQVLTAVGEGRLTQDLAEEATALAQEARGLETQLADAEAVKKLSDWLDRASALEQEVTGEPAAREALAQARRAGEAALMAMAQSLAGVSGQDSSALAGGAKPPNSSESGRAAPLEGTSNPQTSSAGQTPTPKEGTIPGSEQTAEAGSTPLPPVGVQRGALESARDAQLVQLWLEHLKKQ
ncbi:MAG TPA: hypothetical protein EYQ25_03420 [Planctomycetes bacterium]|nr:hypothetical protein [Planctomycetota bacterium]HIL36964.1 hypothetical protein [Planctomycetota bacterium]